MVPARQPPFSIILSWSIYLCLFIYLSIYVCQQIFTATNRHATLTTTVPNSLRPYCGCTYYISPAHCAGDNNTSPNYNLTPDVKIHRRHLGAPAKERLYGLVHVFLALWAADSPKKTRQCVDWDGSRHSSALHTYNRRTWKGCLQLIITPYKDACQWNSGVLCAGLAVCMTGMSVCGILCWKKLPLNS